MDEKLHFSTLNINYIMLSPLGSLFSLERQIYL